MTEHKHAEVLRAIADGKKVQCSAIGQRWRDPVGDENPISYDHFSWRVKPEPKPDTYQYWRFEPSKALQVAEVRVANAKLIYDGETGKLKSAVLLE